MNNTNFYRLNADGSVQMASVKVPQPSLATRQRSKGKVLNLRVIENHMLRAGWTRRKLKPTQRRPMVQAVMSAIRAYTLPIDFPLRAIHGRNRAL